MLGGLTQCIWGLLTIVGLTNPCVLTNLTELAWRVSITDFTMFALLSLIFAARAMGQALPTYNAQGDYWEIKNVKATV